MQGKGMDDTVRGIHTNFTKKSLRRKTTGEIGWIYPMANGEPGGRLAVGAAILLVPTEHLPPRPAGNQPPPSVAPHAIGAAAAAGAAGASAAAAAAACADAAAAAAAVAACRAAAAAAVARAAACSSSALDF